MRHITHIEFDGHHYYWWCEAEDCEEVGRHFVYEADCAADAGEHEREAVQ